MQVGSEKHSKDTAMATASENLFNLVFQSEKAGNVLTIAGPRKRKNLTALVEYAQITHLGPT